VDVVGCCEGEAGLLLELGGEEKIERWVTGGAVARPLFDGFVNNERREEREGDGLACAALPAARVSRLVR
jgi:hypothetical protein